MLLSIPTTYALMMGWWLVSVLCVLIWLALVSFFRDPWRNVPTQLPDGVMLSPADGVISAIEYVDHHEATGEASVIVRIFLSVLNVHINRAPCRCTLVRSIYREGKFLNAQTEESAKVNESNLLMLEAHGEAIGVRQVSGKIARHIVCQLQTGETLERGQRFGMIKFGSTTELILPRPNDVTVHVSKGDKVKGGLTQVATLAPK